MATCYISEYESVGVPGPEADSHQAPREPAIAEQFVGIAASTTQSSPFNVRTRLVRVHVDSVCSIAFGVSPTAVTTAKRLAAGQTEYFAVTGGQRLAVIQNV